MSTHLYLAPAAAGKTAYVLARARDASRDLAAVPRVVVPTHLQARAARRRLAEMGGAIGVRVLTFDRLYAEVLDAAGEIYVELSEPVQYRLIRAVVDSLPLTHYAPLADRPGFIQVLQRLIGELKAARASRTISHGPCGRWATSRGWPSWRRSTPPTRRGFRRRAGPTAPGWGGWRWRRWNSVRPTWAGLAAARRGRVRQLHADPGRAAVGPGRPRGGAWSSH